MSYTFLQEQGEESSAGCFSDIEPFVRSRLNLTAEKFSCNDSETESCLGSRSGTMCEPSTESRGEALQMLCAEGSPVRTLVLQETGLGLKEKEAVSGKKCHGLFARLDQESSLWKTPQLWLFEGLESSLETWPRWGMMQNGECFLLPMLEHSTSARESGSWPTPRKSLIAAACTMATVANIKNPRGNLEEVIFSRAENKQDADFLKSGVNPEFCEWLMVWPIGWTGLEPLATDNFQQWQNLHGRF